MRLLLSCSRMNLPSAMITTKTSLQQSLYRFNEVTMKV
jgi:hypothetical protein